MYVIHKIEHPEEDFAIYLIHDGDKLVEARWATEEETNELLAHYGLLQPVGLTQQAGLLVSSIESACDSIYKMLLEIDRRLIEREDTG